MLRELGFSAVDQPEGSPVAHPGPTLYPHPGPRLYYSLLLVDMERVVVHLRVILRSGTEFLEKIRNSKHCASRHSYNQSEVCKIVTAVKSH